MTRYVLVILLLASCGSSTIPPASDGLSVALALYVERGGRRVEVPPGGQVHSNEVFQFEVSPSRAAYLYVGLRHEDGKTEVMFPDRNEQVLVGGEKITIPGANADSELAFDDHPGQESLVVIASLKPLSQADAEASGLTFAETEGSASEPAQPGQPMQEPVVAPPVDAAVAVEASPDAQPPVRETHEPVPTRIAQRQHAGGATTQHGAPLRVVSNNRIARGVVRRAKHPVVDADAANVVVFPYVVEHVN